MDIEQAAQIVRKDIGEPIALVEIKADPAFYISAFYIAIAYRWEVTLKRDHMYAYSTHLVTSYGCECGHYDMSEEEAKKDLIRRIS